jgi:purine-binding chemotaxis protein CheW
MRLMPIQLRTVWVALDATHLLEVLGARAWVPLPGAPAHLPGVVPWRGRAIALLDLAALAGVAPPLAPGEVRPRVVVARVGELTFGIPAETAREVHEVAGAEVGPLRAIELRHAVGQVTLDGALMPVVSLTEVVRAVTERGA